MTLLALLKILPYLVSLAIAAAAVFYRGLAKAQKKRADAASDRLKTIEGVRKVQHDTEVLDDVALADRLTKR